MLLPTLELQNSLPENTTIRIGIREGITTHCPENTTAPAKDVFTCLGSGRGNPAIYFLYMLSSINASFEFVHFSTAGSLNPNGSGYTDALVRKDIDLSFFSMILTEKRYSLTVMTLPMIFTPLEIYYESPTAETFLGPDLLFRPFDRISWTLVITASLILIYLAFKHDYCRTVFLMAMASRGIICLFYSSNLKAVLTGKVVHRPFHDIRSLSRAIHNGEYRLVLNYLDDFRMEMVRNAEPFSEFYNLRQALDKFPPIKIKSRRDICNYLLDGNRSAVQGLGMATIDVRHNMKAYCGLHYRYLHQINVNLYLSAGLMFAPSKKGHILGELANRYYDFLRGITGTAKEERKLDMEDAIERKEEEMALQFTALTRKSLTPLATLSAVGVTAGVVLLFAESFWYHWNQDQGEFDLANTVFVIGLYQVIRTKLKG